MKRWIPILILGCVILYLLTALKPARHTSPYDLKGFGQIPVLEGGRIKPLDSIARNSLLLIRGKQTLRLDGEKISALAWLLDVVFKPEVADAYPVFVINNPDILGLLHQKQRSNKYYTFKELLEHTGEIAHQSEQAFNLEANLRSPFQKDIMHLHERMVLYHRLKNSILLAGTLNPTAELQIYQATIEPGMRVIHDHQKGDTSEHDMEVMQRLMDLSSQYRALDELAYFRMLPPIDKKDAVQEWATTGQGMLEILRDPEVHPALPPLLEMGTAYQREEVARFNAAIVDYLVNIRELSPKHARKAYYETIFNNVSPFYRAMLLYVLVFLISFISWLVWPQELGRTAYIILWFAFILHTAGLLYRMILEGRPPVTNLYSSAVFIGWGSVLLTLFLEFLHKKGIGSVVAGFLGFGTLIIAHHLSLSGDTMEMMRAVLDSNFWLSTHVITVTIGYSSTFLAGFMAMLFILRGLLSKSLTPDLQRSTSQMVFGIICFSAFFSFIGTVLGGIWADQSWGRFWGWDPKENGALLIVLWNIIILHALLSRTVRVKGLMVMAVFGNIITSWSWFGTNMLGVGLHSYGFMDSAFVALMLFVGSQALIMGLGMLPNRIWRSNLA